MPRQAKQNGDDTEGTVHEAAPTNGYDPSVVAKVVKQWEDCQLTIDNLATDCRKEQQPYRDKQKEIINKAAEKHGIPKKELRSIFAERRHRRSADQVRDGLNENQKLTYDQLRTALGMLADLPLGQAATEAASPPA